MIEIKNFTKKFGNKVAVNNLELEIKDGELFSFIGHNGAGKTTTIKAMVGINSIEVGDIKINGVSIKENPLEAKKKFAYIPDNPDIYEGLTGSQYLNFIADMFEVKSEDRNKIIREYAQIFEIDKDLNSLISSYSHGMKQKLVIISALVHSPEVLILDEPFVGLDPMAALKVKNILRDFCDRGGIVFLTSHVLEVVEKISDRVAIIKDGEIKALGTVKEIAGDNSLEHLFMELNDNE
ncbi:ABC transporter ATP-binding protein [uncultured Clostridium sp.]|jgi:ABC-2 type transport system ATP-binding protein|uniref:ABC transporter ATP-binding protein n=1 Tax=uncultured Clostridium sp. TaxID=59620 RepID=UPI00262CF314|nr:ABC transporter ATP-binding protein [uncultured Clostridium sp.]